MISLLPFFGSTLFRPNAAPPRPCILNSPTNFHGRNVFLLRFIRTVQPTTIASRYVRSISRYFLAAFSIVLGSVTTVGTTAILRKRYSFDGNGQKKEREIARVRRCGYSLRVGLLVTCSVIV